MGGGGSGGGGGGICVCVCVWGAGGQWWKPWTRDGEVAALHII